MKTLILLIGIFVVCGEFFGNFCCDDLKVSDTDVDSCWSGRSRRKTPRNVDAMQNALLSTYPLDWPAATSCVTSQQNKRHRIKQGNYKFDEYVALTCTLAVYRGSSLARFFHRTRMCLVQGPVSKRITSPCTNETRQASPLSHGPVS